MFKNIHINWPEAGKTTASTIGPKTSFPPDFPTKEAAIEAIEVWWKTTKPELYQTVRAMYVMDLETLDVVAKVFLPVPAPPVLYWVLQPPLGRIHC